MIAAHPISLAPDEALLFLHIPKTAGTTLNAVLDEQFRPAEVRELPSWMDLPKYDIDYAPYRFLRGHVYYDVRKVLPRRLRFMTVLRDPVERAISSYEMMRRAPNDPWNPVVREMSFADFVMDARTRPLFENLQTRFIASEFQLRRMADIATATEVRPAGLLDVARERLSSFDFVGLTELLKESIELLFYTFGWFPRPIHENLNIAPTGRLRRDDLPAEILREVTELTALDAELHRFAGTLLETRRSEMMHQVLIDRWRWNQTDRGLGPTSADFSGAWFGSGWYMREVHPHHGYYRWIGPDPSATLWVQVPRASAVEVRFRVIASCTDEILNKLRLTSNGIDIPLELTADPNGGIVFTGRLPSETLARLSAVTELTWVLPYTRHPSSWDPGNPDPRRLGIAVNLVELKPLG